MSSTPITGAILPAFRNHLGLCRAGIQVSAFTQVQRPVRRAASCNSRYTPPQLFEIAGCFAFWAWLKLDKSALWLAPGMVCLALFAYLLTLIESNVAGRAYAAYGGIYIIASILWIWFAEGTRPDRWDVVGACTAFAGTCIILFAHRS
ncbi:YnfA family protein [Ochrobactrum oryzae]|nr:YnfA family protein [Brucella oryzae]